MLTLEQVDLSNKKQVNEFIQFHYDLYSGCEQWVPPFYTDIQTMLDKKKHPFYDHSDAEFFMVRDGKKVVGRIALIENRPFNEYHHTKKAQFYLFDCIDQQEVCDLLFDTASEWAKKRGLDTIIGPKGFGALDGYGILVEGFEYRQMMNMMNYNYAYYPKLMADAGFEKANDFVSCYVDPTKYKLPEKVQLIADKVQERGTITVKKFKNKKELISWGERIGIAYNEAFTQNWVYYPLTKREIKNLIDTIMMVIDPKLIKILISNEKIIGFLFVFPDISKAMQRAKGKINLFSLIDILLELKRTNWISLNGVGVLPEYQGRGGNAVLYSEILKTIHESHIEHAEETQMADTAVQVRKDMEHLGARIYKRHRVFEKKIT